MCEVTGLKSVLMVTHMLCYFLHCILHFQHTNQTKINIDRLISPLSSRSDNSNPMLWHQGTMRYCYVIMADCSSRRNKAQGWFSPVIIRQYPFTQSGMYPVCIANENRGFTTSVSSIARFQTWTVQYDRQIPIGLIVGRKIGGQSERYYHDVARPRL